MKFVHMRRFLCSFIIATSITFGGVSHFAWAQDNWAANDDAFEARKIERYQQLVDGSPEKSYAFEQLMASVGKGAAFQKLLQTYEQKVAKNPKNFNLRMVLGHMYQHAGRTNDAILSYKLALDIKPSPLTYISIAAAEAENKNFDPAIEYYEAALKLNTSKAQTQDIWRAMAQIALARRDMARADACFTQLIKLEPNSMFVRRELAQIYSENRRYPEARAVLEAAAKMSAASNADKEQISFDIADLYEREGNDTEALSRYEALAQKLSDSHWMQRELSARIIDIHRRNGQIQGLPEALEKQYKSPTYQQHLDLADLYQETANPDKALEHIHKAIQKSSRLPEAREKLVQFYRSHGQIDAMIEAKQALIQTIPDNPEYRFELYDIFVQQKKPDKALATLDEIQKKFRADFDVQRRVAQAYQLHGHTQKALAIYESWTKDNPRELHALEALGDQYDAMGNKKKALETWAKIDAIPMDQATKLESLARIYDEHGYAEKAEQLYVKALANSPNDCQIHEQYADVLARNGKQLQAIEAWKALANACPTRPVQDVAARQLATLYAARGQQETALNQYRGACEANPNHLPTVLMFAALAKALNLPQYAIATLETFVQNNPTQTEAISELSALYAASQNLDAARQTLENLAKISEIHRRESLLSLAELDVLAGDLHTATEHFTEALRLNANDPDTHERLGDIYVSLRRYDEANQHYETAFQIDPRNFAVAFKSATCYAILGKLPQADAIYVNIITNTTDQDLALKAAQRAIDDHAFLGSLDALATTLLPLQRSSQRKALYLDILLTLADAQVQPHALALQTKEQPLAARHALRVLSEKYAALLVESLLQDDPSISAKALALTQWMTPPNVIPILGQIIDQAPTTESGRLTQLQAIRAIAHAQLPAAIPILETYTQPKYARALREHAIWALGLVNSPLATQALKRALDINFDTFRALAVIGLGRQNAALDLVHQHLKSDPSYVVRDSAAWMLAFHQYENAYDDIESLYKDKDLKPHQLWALARISAKNSTSAIAQALWCGDNRAMAAALIQSQMTHPELTTMTRAETQGKFITLAASHYQTNFNLALLFEHFSYLSMAKTDTPIDFLTKNDETITMVAQKIASTNETTCQLQMLRDVLHPNVLTHFDPNDPNQRPILARIATALLPQLQTWIQNAQNQRELAGLSLQMLALTPDQTAFEAAKNLAMKSQDMALRLDAIQALAHIATDQSHAILRTLANDDHYLIRAAALSTLDAKNPDDQALLKNALNDAYTLVAQTAREILNQ